MYISCLVTFFKEDMFTLFKFIFKIVLTVQVFHWALAEADLFLPGVKQFALAQLETYRIPTHDVMLTDGVLSFGEVGQKLDRMLAGVSESSLKVEIPSALLGSNVRLEDLKYMALNNLPVNPVKVFENQELNQVLRGGSASPWQEF